MKSPVPTKEIKAYLPEDIYRELYQRLYDPLSGRVPYGAISSLVTNLLEEYFLETTID